MKHRKTLLVLLTLLTGSAGMIAFQRYGTPSVAAEMRAGDPADPAGAVRAGAAGCAQELHARAVR